MIKKLKGFTLIELLIVVAIIAILAAIAIPNFLEAQVRAKVARVRSDLRSLAIGIESYYVDNSTYPSQDSSSPQSATNGSGYGANNFPPTNGANYSQTEVYGRNMPTFRRKKDANDPMRTLTTPISYITSYFVDPFATSKRYTFSYSTARNGSQWILWSYGPDNDETAQKGEPAPPPPPHGGDFGIDIDANSPFLVSIDTYYYPGAFNQTPSEDLIKNTYDPTNGSTSGGDVYKYKD